MCENARKRYAEARRSFDPNALYLNSFRKEHYEAALREIGLTGLRSKSKEDLFILVRENGITGVQIKASACIPDYSVKAGVDC